MADRPRTRQELYDRIRRTSKEEFILEDMIRLGFWPAAGQLPQDPAEEIRRRGEIQRELEALRKQQSQLHNEAALLREWRKRRLQESRQRQLETRQRRERERKERAAAWQRRKAAEIGYLGEGVSGGLAAKAEAGHEARLRAAGLPVLRSAEDLAAAMGLSVASLRFLAYARRASSVSHYVRFRLPKKTGGERLISAPMPRLKRAQGWILKEILEKVADVHEAAHGFRPGRSIVSNAQPHVGQAVVLNLDLQDFFPTVTYRRVKGLFESLGYAEAVATVLGLLCTEPDVEEVTLDGRRFFVALTERHLPQGAPTSPAVTNLLCRRLDRRLTRVAEQRGCRYTRYADDLTFSGGAGLDVAALLGQIAFAVEREGFRVHPGKTRVQRRGRRQEVTGLVVNRQVGVPRELLRRFRATLFQLEKDGPAGKRWGQGADVLASAMGFANYVHMVDPRRGAPLRERVLALWTRHGAPKHAAPAATAGERPAPQGGAELSPEPEPPKKKWWKLW